MYTIKVLSNTGVEVYMQKVDPFDLKALVKHVNRKIGKNRLREIEIEESRAIADEAFDGLYKRLGQIAYTKQGTAPSRAKHTDMLPGIELYAMWNALTQKVDIEVHQETRVVK